MNNWHKLSEEQPQKDGEYLTTYFIKDENRYSDYFISHWFDGIMHIPIQINYKYGIKKYKEMYWHELPELPNNNIHTTNEHEYIQRKTLQ